MDGRLTDAKSLVYYEHTYEPLAQLIHEPSAQISSGSGELTGKITQNV